MTTPIQQAAFEELSQGGGFFNHIEQRCQPMLTSELFDIFNTQLPAIFNGTGYFYTPTGTPAQILAVNTFRSNFFTSLQNSMPEFYNAWYTIIGRNESPQEDPLFALNKIPGVSSSSISASLIEQTDKYFGHRKGAPYGYYKSGLPPLLIKFSSAKSVNDVMTALQQNSYPFPPNPTYPTGYFANTFPKLDIAPFLNASIPLLPGNTWYDEMVGTISGAIYPQIDTMNTYYSTTLSAFSAAIGLILINIVSTIASITNFTTFTSNSPNLTGYLINIQTAYATEIGTNPPPVTERNRIDAQIIQENARYYAHSFVMLNQGSVSTGFYQYKNDPNAYPILETCSTPTMLAALNEVIPTP